MVAYDYSKLLTKEEYSLTAINELRGKYPYAASLLIYTVLERCLKIYLMGNRNESKVQSELDLTTIINKNQLSYLIKNITNDDNFLNDVLMHCTLGTLEKIFKFPNKPFSTNRNDIVHSNLYLRDQQSDTYAERRKKNEGYLTQAIKDLIDASKYFHKDIIDDNGILKFK